ncbi:MAG: hypothetical protein ACRDD5_18775 [Silvania sp.]|uniref:hypothetical protein n=1 Tax=Silvania sp. TaxID=3016633 RepID=UPI003EE5C462
MNIIRRLKRLFHQFFFTTNCFFNGEYTYNTKESEVDGDNTKLIGINHDVTFNVAFDDAPYFFMSKNCNSISQLVLNGHHPFYVLLSLKDERHPLLYFLTTWVKLCCVSDSKQFNDFMSVAKILWENELSNINAYKLNYQFGSLPSFILFDMNYHNGEVQLLINRRHIFYVHYILRCKNTMQHEFMLALMAWCIAESNILSQVNLQKMVKARAMINTFLYNLVDESLASLEVEDAK